MKKRNLLIVCINRKDFSQIRKLDLSDYTKVVLASDDYNVHKECEKLDAIDKVTFIQKSISYPKVSASVIDMITKVNIYLDKVSELGIFNKKELFWSHHVEGGYATQRLQDALLAIECANLIFEKYAITELITIGSKNLLSLKVLKRIAINKGYKITSHNRKISLFDFKRIKDLIRPIYFLLRSLICKITSKRFNYFTINKIILFQIFGSGSKHIENALFPQDEISKTKYTPINIMWGSTRGVKKINNRGYKTIALESYLKYGDILISIFKTILVFVNFKSLKRLFYKTNTFIYKSLDITDIVFESSMQYLYTDGPENYRYRASAQRFISEYSKNLAAIKYSGAKFLTQATILSNIIDDKFLKFDYEVGLRIPNYYIKFNAQKNHNFLSNNFLRFVPNEVDKKYLIEDMCVPENSVVNIGAGSASRHFKKAKYLSKEESKKELGIKKDYEIYLLLNFTGPYPGFQSLEEVIYLSSTILDYAKDNPSIAIIVKPHPSSDLSYLNLLLTNSTDNIYLVDRKELPDHALNIADLMFCKFTTMGIEAMVYDVQVVSMLLDNEDIFKVFGEAAEYIYCKEDLTNFLKNTLESKDTFIEWKNSYAKKRKKFISEYYPKIEKTSAKIIQETVIRNIASLKNDFV